MFDLRTNDRDIDGRGEERVCDLAEKVFVSDIGLGWP